MIYINNITDIISKTFTVFAISVTKIRKQILIKERDLQYEQKGHVMEYNTIKSMIYDSIWNDIINGVYDWEYIFTEKSIIEKYQVSKSPVRDAMVELCKDNILKSIPRYGYKIVQIPEKQLREMVEFRDIVETNSLRSAFPNLGQPQFNLIREYNLRSKLLVFSKDSTPRQLWDDNMQFHRLLYSFSRNEFGSMMLDRCLQMQTMAYVQLYQFTKDINQNMTTTSHERIESLIVNGDCEGAISALRDDIYSIEPAHSIF